MKDTMTALLFPFLVGAFLLLTGCEPDEGGSSAPGINDSTGCSNDSGLVYNPETGECE